LKLKADSEVKTETMKIAELKHGATSPGGQDKWSQERLQIPPCPPTMTEVCKYIEITYYLHVSITYYLHLNTTFICEQNTFNICSIKLHVAVISRDPCEPEFYYELFHLPELDADFDCGFSPFT
jgi:hypothetical protein